MKNITLKIKPALLILLLFLEIFALIIFARNPHRIRAALFKVIETDDRKYFTWRPEKPPSWYSLDPPQLYKDFMPEAQKVIFNISSEFQQYVALMQYTKKLANGNHNDSQITSDSICDIKKLLKEGYKGNCARYSWLFMTYLRSLDRDVRIIGLEQRDGLGAHGHAINEVWVKEWGKWVLFDVYNNVFLTSDGIPLSVLEIRDNLYQGKSNLIQVHQGDISGISKNTIINYDKIINYYYADNMMQDITLDATAGLIHKYEHRYGILKILTPAFDRLPRKVWRALENIFGEADLRIHFIDNHSTHYHPLLYRIIFRLLILSVFITLCTIFWQFYRKLPNFKN